ncbi:enterochelin esterase [Rhodococcus jostii]|uniref:Enterochelin esterase n=1 Tax=Rhodococcus jostii TaxID=132919 RepID=A0A1H5BXH6_RHOJO|nr:enterochelin esterase [Rhodococcus jostii]SED59243.1 enterochelin esterase [Rhodococcus jostii]
MLQRVPGPERRVVRTRSVDDLTREDVPAFWDRLAAVGSPLIESDGADPGCVVATFCWRDPEGDERTSRTRHVYLDANGITDRSRPERAALSRLPGTDLWSLSIEVPENWRGAYCFIPRVEPLSGPGDTPGWQWWRSVLAGAHPDPFNPLPTRVVQAGDCSEAVMPGAPAQRWWTDRPGGGRAHETAFTLSGTRRSVWVYEPPGLASEDRPVVVMLDGRTWAVDLPIAGAVDALGRAAGHRVPLVVMVDSVGPELRTEELGCSAEFAAGLAGELLPWLRREWSATEDPASTIVAGCSLGGLTACFLALTAPHVFGCAVSLSGSFWWPGSGTGTTFQERVRTTARSGSRFGMEVGTLEWMLVEPHREVRDLLLETGHDVRYREFCGGHDVLHWRDGLIGGIAAML